MICYVEVWELTKDTPRDAKVVAEYKIDAESLLAARLAGAGRYQAETGKVPDVVYGTTRPRNV